MRIELPLVPWNFKSIVLVVICIQGSFRSSSTLMNILSCAIILISKSWDLFCLFRAYLSINRSIRVLVNVLLGRRKLNAWSPCSRQFSSCDLRYYLKLLLDWWLSSFFFDNSRQPIYQSIITPLAWRPGPLIMIFEVPSYDLLLIYNSRCEAPNSSSIAHIVIETITSSCKSLLNFFLDMVTIHCCWLPFSEDQCWPECVV